MTSMLSLASPHIAEPKPSPRLGPENWSFQRRSPETDLRLGPWQRKRRDFLRRVDCPEPNPVFFHGSRISALHWPHSLFRTPLVSFTVNVRFEMNEFKKILN